MSDSANVHTIGGEAKFKEICAAAGSKLVLLDFTATWCPPCKMLGPILKKIAS